MNMPKCLLWLSSHACANSADSGAGPYLHHKQQTHTERSHTHALTDVVASRLPPQLTPCFQTETQCWTCQPLEPWSDDTHTGTPCYTCTFPLLPSSTRHSECSLTFTLNCRTVNEAVAVAGAVAPLLVKPPLSHEPHTAPTVLTTLRVAARRAAKAAVDKDNMVALGGVVAVHTRHLGLWLMLLLMRPQTVQKLRKLHSLPQQSQQRHTSHTQPTSTGVLPPSLPPSIHSTPCLFY